MLWHRKKGTWQTICGSRKYVIYSVKSGEHTFLIALAHFRIQILTGWAHCNPKAYVAFFVLGDSLIGHLVAAVLAHEQWAAQHRMGQASYTECLVGFLERGTLWTTSSLKQRNSSQNRENNLLSYRDDPFSEQPSTDHLRVRLKLMRVIESFILGKTVDTRNL